MRLAGRIAAAIEVLADIEQRRRPVSEALKAWGLDHRFAGAGDRAAIGNLVYDALRRRASHAWAMGEDTPRALILSVMVRDWGETPDSLATLFAEDAHAPDPLTEAEIARLSAPDPLASAPDAVRADIPDWLAPSLSRGLGESWVAELAAMTGRPSLDLRVNTLKSDRERVTRSLSRLSPQPGAYARDSLVLPAGPRDARTPNVTADEGYLKGWFEVQDQGSQMVAALAAARQGEQVLDLCAGAGGKTLALAAAMQNRGQIFAHDSDRNRLAPIYDRLKRAAARNVQVRSPRPDALEDLVARMDLVLVDAPCTGAGTWRRRPDTKFRLTPELLATRTAEQSAILADAARYVRQGGRLVYVTCSLLAEENADQIAAFRAAHPDFLPLDLAALWPEILDGAPVPPDPAGGLTLSPLRTGTDGFYIAALKRTG
jgi:16S rRNA (cytosine967-C5)-methyltransferase